MKENKLFAAAQHLLHLNACEQEGIASGMPSRQAWDAAFRKLHQALEAEASSTRWEPLELAVKYYLHSAFRAKAESIAGVKVVNVVEMKTCEVMTYILECLEEHKENVCDLAFMTWITNPIFQKYYHGCEPYEKAKEAYLKERERNEK